MLSGVGPWVSESWYRHTAAPLTAALSPLRIPANRRRQLQLRPACDTHRQEEHPSSPSNLSHSPKKCAHRIAPM
eukprot:1199790-Amphidinium_carterae.1